MVLVTMFLAFIARSVLFSPYFIPSGSMMPSLRVGDFFIASRFDYGISPRSFLANAPMTPRIGHGLPDRGDIVVFAGPTEPSINIVKRVVGLPGDTISMKDGTLSINGIAAKSILIDDFVVARSSHVPCLVIPGTVDQTAVLADGRDACRFHRSVETLPGGKQFATIDIAPAFSDTFDNIVVPDGFLFVMGDNRDDSLDSRVPHSMGGVGFLPQENLLGKLRFVIGSDAKGTRFMGERALAAD